MHTCAPYQFMYKQGRSSAEARLSRRGTIPIEAPAACLEAIPSRTLAPNASRELSHIFHIFQRGCGAPGDKGRYAQVRGQTRRPLLWDFVRCSVAVCTAPATAFATAPEGWRTQPAASLPAGNAKPLLKSPKPGGLNDLRTAKLPCDVTRVTWSATWVAPSERLAPGRHAFKPVHRVANHCHGPWAMGFGAAGAIWKCSLLPFCSESSAFPDTSLRMTSCGKNGN